MWSHNNFEFFQKKVKDINSKAFSAIREKVIAQKKINIGFLVNEVAKWNCSSIVRLMKEDDFFSCHIYHDINLDGPLNLEDKIIKYKKENIFLKAIDPDVKCLFDEKLKVRKSMSEYDVDIIFFQQPWGLSEHLLDTLGKSLSIYIPYAYIIYDVPQIDYGIREFHGLLWKYLSQSDEQKKNHLKFDSSISGRQWVVGYPKFDEYKICNKSSETVDVLNIIYAPHHSFKKNLLKIATFDRNSYLFLDFAKNKFNDKNWIYKPHPRLQSSVIENEVMKQEEYLNYLNQWHSLANAEVNLSGDYIKVFENSDILITDCASFLAEYFPTGKPIVWLRSQHSELVFNNIGEDISKAFYAADTDVEINMILEELIYKKNDYKKEIRSEMIKKYFSNFGSSGNKVIQYLKNAFMSS